MFFSKTKFTKYLILTVFLSNLCFVSVFAQVKTAVEQELQKATAALSQNDLTQAKKILQRLLLTAPKNVSVQTLSGIVADRENDLQAAEKHFALAAKYAPRSPESRNNYGAILVRLSRNSEAAKEFAASLALNPNQSSALVNLARIRLDENNLQAAQALFEKAENIAPDAEIERALVLIALRLDQKERAAAAFQKYYSLPIQTSETSLSSELNLAKTLSDKDLQDESRRILERILSQKPDEIDALVLLARLYVKQKNIREAGRLLESAVSKNIADAKIYLALSEVYQAAGFMENAVPAMRLAIEKEPLNDFYLARYGLLLIDAKAPAAAIIRLKEYIQIIPNSARLWLTLGIAEQIDGKAVDARESFKKVLQIDPNSVPALAYLATSYIEQAQYAEAVQTYQRAVDLDRENSILHYLLADTLLKISASDAAQIQNHLNRSVQLDETFAPAHFALGKVYARDNNWERAAAEFEKTVRYDPESAEAYYQLGRALARLKRTPESQAAIEKYKVLSESQTKQKETDRQDLVRRLANTSF